MHLVGFIVGIYYDARTYERQICFVQGDTKKLELLKTPTKIEEIQEKKNY